MLAQAALELRGAGLAVDVALHLGTLLAVLVVYRGAVLELARGLLAGSWREVGLLALASVPAGVLGVLFGDAVEEAFAAPRLAAACLCATAAILVLGEWARRRGAGRAPAQLSVRSALLVGAFQALAILPGVSRSGSTIAAGLLVGLAPERAARTSFLLSIPAVLGASLLHLPALGEEGAVPPAALLGAVALAALVGWAALRVLLAFLSRGAFLWFAAYCALLGGGYLVLG